MKHDKDLNRQMRGIYARGNSLLKRFKYCNNEVKMKLFKAYCTNFYCLSLWSKFTQQSHRKVKSAYNRIFRNFMNVERDDMVHFMVNNNVKTFQEIERTLIFSFKSRIDICDNIIVSVVRDSLFNNTSFLTVVWNKVLYL